MPDSHIFSHRLDRRFGAIRDASVAFCGFTAPDAAPAELYPDRDPVVVQGLGQKIADLRCFARDAVASCKACRRARDGVRPGRLRRFWRWVTRTGPAPEPAPDRIVDP